MFYIDISMLVSYSYSCFSRIMAGIVFRSCALFGFFRVRSYLLLIPT